MRLPVIKQIERTSSIEEIETAIKVLESTSEAASLKDADLDMIGELISNLCGAIEVKQLIAEGFSEKDALNSFMKKVMGSIDA
jgi:signal-transduction protein with cAMP-binding, CBS, and nucleotidyltransferase domain